MERCKASVVYSPTHPISYCATGGIDAMKLSTNHILTTHTGSLPRPTDLIELIQKVETGGAVDPEAFQARIKTAVAETVQKQVEAGIDVINDGEAGKPGYSTYVKDRLTGFGG